MFDRDDLEGFAICLALCLAIASVIAFGFIL
jgi:hypothetical protein